MAVLAQNKSLNKTMWWITKIEVNILTDRLVVSSYNPSTQEAKANLGYIGRPCLKKPKENIQALVAHAYNHSYSGGRDQKDYSVSPA
jgi:hypothetical protein